MNVTTSGPGARPPSPWISRGWRRLVAGVVLSAGLVACGGDDDLSTPPELVSDRPSFSGATALALVDTQVAFGPRVPGTEGHRAQLDWMVERLGDAADTVLTQAFTHTHSETGEELSLTNVVARFRPEVERRLLFLAHWDTRPTSDAAAAELQDTPVPGANDGASGTAVLLAAADLLATDGPEVGVDILLVDGEDYGPSPADMFLGARHYAVNQLTPRPVYGVLLDMVGDATPRFPIEGNSAVLAPQVATRVWNVAHALGYGPYFPRTTGQPLNDDHIPLNQAGIPTVNVIDFDYGPANSFWHTPEDTVDKIRAGTLEMVGELVLALIYMGG